jgi:hypothetical protein
LGRIEVLKGDWEYVWESLNKKLSDFDSYIFVSFAIQKIFLLDILKIKADVYIEAMLKNQVPRVKHFFKLLSTSQLIFRISVSDDDTVLIGFIWIEDMFFCVRSVIVLSDGSENFIDLVDVAEKVLKNAGIECRCASFHVYQIIIDCKIYWKY